MTCPRCQGNLVHESKVIGRNRLQCIQCARYYEEVDGDIIPFRTIVEGIQQPNKHERSKL
jgi:hypothetical protein